MKEGGEVGLERQVFDRRQRRDVVGGRGLVGKRVLLRFDGGFRRIRRGQLRLVRFGQRLAAPRRRLALRPAG
jgi:hypothetical protein